MKLKLTSTLYFVFALFQSLFDLEIVIEIRKYTNVSNNFGTTCYTGENLLDKEKISVQKLYNTAILGSLCPVIHISLWYMMRYVNIKFLRILIKSLRKRI